MTLHHEARHLVENLDGVSDSRHCRLEDAWPEQRRLGESNGPKKLRELPASAPAELAEFADDPSETDDFFVELSDDDAVAAGPFDDDSASHIELDAA